MPYKVLIVDDESNIVDLLSEIASEFNLDIITAENGEQALNIFNANKPDFVFMDIFMPVIGGMQAMDIMKREYPEAPVILMTAFGTVDIAIDAIQSGAFEYLVKPASLGEIRGIFRRVIHYLDIKNEGFAAQSPVKKLVGVSASMQNIFKMIAKIAETNATVLITGESGNGKQVIAETIHSLSQRKGRFVQTNCCGIPETLIESEMFGFTKGSFSGAIASKKGKFELSDRGSIFLDEIGELPKNMQGKLLHVLQEREITPIGAYEPLKLDLRIIAATNKDLESMVQNGSFRLDLFHRLKIIHIHVPPLRERIDDIEPLIIHFTEMFSHKYNVAAPPIDKKVMEWAKSYSWPGNIREMKNLIEREILLDSGILYENIIAHFEQNYAQGTPSYDESVFEDETLSSAVNKFERRIIERTLIKYDGNRSRSAKALGISRRALLYKIKEYNIN